jgi:hypothetical protein
MYVSFMKVLPMTCRMHLARYVIYSGQISTGKTTRTGLLANAKSALSLIASDTLVNDTCRITLCGEDETQAAVQLRTLLSDLPTLALNRNQ